MADLDYKKENMKELHAPDKRVKTGVYVIAALLVLVPASNLCDVKPILPLYDRSVAETVSAGKMDTG